MADLDAAPRTYDDFLRRYLPRQHEERRRKHMTDEEIAREVGRKIVAAALDRAASREPQAVSGSGSASSTRAWALLLASRRRTWRSVKVR